MLLSITESRGNGPDARFEINLNGCKFRRSDDVLYLAQVFFMSLTGSAMIQMDCVKDVCSKAHMIVLLV